MTIHENTRLVVCVESFYTIYTGKFLIICKKILPAVTCSACCTYAHVCTKYSRLGKNNKHILFVYKQ